MRHNPRLSAGIAARPGARSSPWTTRRGSAGTRYRDLTIRGPAHALGQLLGDGWRMSFNWRLLLAPAGVLDYVVWHEVCHLEVMDHSPRFWSLLERRWPNWREDREWLRRHGAALVLDSGA